MPDALDELFNPDLDADRRLPEPEADAPARRGAGLADVSIDVHAGNATELLQRSAA